MVIIKLSAHRKIVVIGMVMLLAAFFSYLVAAQSFKNEEDKSDVTSETTTVTQSYVPETRDECVDTTEAITIEDIALESQNEPEVSMTKEDTDAEIVSESTEEDAYIQHYTQQDAIDIAKVLYNECRGVDSITEQACVAWTILNRVDFNNSSVYSVTT